MKMKYIMAVLVAGLVIAAADMNAQVGKRYYINAGWQANATVAQSYVKQMNGWGAYAEGGYYLTPKLAVGGFVSYNTNLEYVGRKVYELPGGAAVSTDLNNSIFQIPFGATLRYRFTRSRLEPYVEAKLGANYASCRTYFSTMATSDNSWGAYLSPEAGLTWHPFNRTNFGFQFAVYYSYASNSSKYFDVKGLNNVGIKLGLSF